MIDHTIVHFEIPANDAEKLRRFYTELFGWRIEKTAGPMDIGTSRPCPWKRGGCPCA